MTRKTQNLPTKLVGLGVVHQRFLGHLGFETNQLPLKTKLPAYMQKHLLHHAQCRSCSWTRLLHEHIAHDCSTFVSNSSDEPQMPKPHPPLDLTIKVSLWNTGLLTGYENSSKTGLNNRLFHNQGFSTTTKPLTAAKPP